jgi:hypothetical protein
MPQTATKRTNSEDTKYLFCNLAGLSITLYLFAISIHRLKTKNRYAPTSDTPTKLLISNLFYIKRSIFS